MVIDTSFDFRTDATTRDPDQSSPTLRRYHRLLWSKRLPSGIQFELDTTTRGNYLHHSSEVGEFFLGSDSVIPTYSYWASTARLIAQLARDEINQFVATAYTIGGMLVFPSNKVDRKPTLNMARGMNRKIADRMDLTLECIRRYYLGDVATPLGTTLERYADFFDLFESFASYVDFFLLQDLVLEDYSASKFFMPFETFDSPAVPADVETYAAYRQTSVDFVVARNRRVAAWSNENLSNERA